MIASGQKILLIDGLRIPFKKAVKSVRNRGENRNREINIHEAGHAIVARRLGIPVEYMSIVPIKNVSDGMVRCTFPATYAETSNEIMRNSLAVNAAGVTATDILGLEYDREHAYSEDKKHSLETLAVLYKRTKPGGETQKNTEEFTRFCIKEIHLAENRARDILSADIDTLLSLAHALSEHYVLDQTDIDKIIQTDPAPAPVRYG